MKSKSFRQVISETPLGGRILLVDDDAHVRTSLSRLLRYSGYAVETADSAEAADQFLNAATVDLCLLDIELPRMSGLEFLSWAEVRDPEMAVIMLTGLDSAEVALECIDKGARTFLVKPVEADFLLRAVRDAMAMRRLLVEHNKERSWPESS